LNERTDQNADSIPFHNPVFTIALDCHCCAVTLNQSDITKLRRACFDHSSVHCNLARESLVAAAKRNIPQEPDRRIMPPATERNWVDPCFVLNPIANPEPTIAAEPIELTTRTLTDKIGEPILYEIGWITGKIATFESSCGM
jgi:hypothetical protein